MPTRLIIFYNITIVLKDILVNNTRSYKFVVWLINSRTYHLSHYITHLSVHKGTSYMKFKRAGTRIL